MNGTAGEPLIRSAGLRNRITSTQAAAVAGIVAAVGWSLSLRGLLAAPGIGATDAQIADFYENSSNATGALLWIQVLTFSTIAFLWFVGVVRGRIGDDEPKLFGTVFFGSSILLAAMLFLGASLLAAPSILVAIGDRVPGADAVSVSRAAAAGVLSVFLPRIATLVMFSTASLGRSTGALPSWLVWLTYAVGTFEFVNVTISAPAVYVVPAWVGLVSVVLLVRHPGRGHGTAEAAPRR